MTAPVTLDLAEMRARAEAVERTNWLAPTTLALLDEVERLTRELAQAVEEGACWRDAAWQISDDAKAEIAKLRARVAELEGK